jgi:enoyl-CoA hydratase/carnithine racemase
MNDSENQVLLTTDDGVATVTLNRPDVLNAITPRMLEMLGDTLAGLAEDPEVAVVVLTGAGRAFSAGVDLKSLQGRTIKNGGVGDILDIPGRRATELLASIPKVVIAKVNGACFTGALELALACDLVVVVETAKLGDTHAKFGLRPSWGMSQRLPRLAGAARARELSYTARTFTGVEAAAWGLAVRAVPAGDLDDTVAELASTVSANSPGSLVAYKDLYRRALDVGLTEGLEYEASTAYVIPDTDQRLSGFR